MKVNRGSVMVAVALALAAPGSADAAPPAASPESVARSLGDEGLRRFQAGKWREAYELFQRADTAFHAVTLVLFMAHCRARQGDLLTARRLYREVVREPLADDAPAQFRSAQAVARQELRWLGLHVALVKISVTGAPAGRARILVDGIEVPAADLDELGVEPGPHVVEASVAGGSTVRRSIATTAGRTTEVPLPLPPSEPRGQLAATPSPQPEAPPHRAPGLSLPAGIAFGLSGAALTAGAVTGGLSLRIAVDVKSRCAFGHCLASDQASAASAGHLADASTGTFITAGVAAAVGVVLAVLDARARKALADPGAGALHVDVGPGAVAVGGAF